MKQGILSGGESFVDQPEVLLVAPPLSRDFLKNVATGWDSPFEIVILSGGAAGARDRTPACSSGVVDGNEATSPPERTSRSTQNLA
jgi:hypothetical protein